jgi:hypothetical protein
MSTEKLILKLTLLFGVKHKNLSKQYHDALCGSTGLVSPVILDRLQTQEVTVESFTAVVRQPEAAKMASKF